MKLLITLCFLVTVFEVNAQDFKFDNTIYQTISWNEFFKRLANNPRLIYFDIRTKGERNDSSGFPSMNQGKIKGAIETDYFDFDKSYPRYLIHKNDSIYLYCSHSRRSRLLAKQLADSGFTKVFNINGGLTYLNTFKEPLFPMKDTYLTTQLPYRLVSPFEFIERVKEKSTILLDVRSDSVYYGIAQSPWENLFGRVENAIHIPHTKIKTHYALLQKTKKVIVFDNDGSLSPVVAKELIEKGYQAEVLLFGLDNLISNINREKLPFLQIRYKTILPSELHEAISHRKNVVIDVRKKSEFNSTDTLQWKNTGRIKNSINIPLSEISEEKLASYKNHHIILYDIMMHDELFHFAEKLSTYQINNFSLLIGGIFNLQWEIYNAGKKELSKLIE